MTSSSAARLLQQTYKKLLQEPVHGCYIEVDDTDFFEWKVFLEGPNDSPYEGGIFQARLKFPADFPMSPPTFRFVSEMWHPNVYTNGYLCISILHPPGEDALSGESAFERWLPIQSVETILLSVVSLLGDPNPSSPANVDAGVEWRNNRAAYLKRCARLVELANKEAPAGIVIPHPDIKRETKAPELTAEDKASMADYYYDDYDYYNDEDNCEEEEGEPSELEVGE